MVYPPLHIPICILFLQYNFISLFYKVYLGASHGTLAVLLPECLRGGLRAVVRCFITGGVWLVEPGPLRTLYL